ncbi:MAG: hypothetical protein OEL83_05775 [Desulforhopalus sp.]|nr:hypothetical protein [Desulforhopalus sp.]
MKIPLRLLDWQKVKKTGRGYTRRELTVVNLLRQLAAQKPITSFLNVGFHDYQDIRNRWWIDICRANNIDWHILEVFEPNVRNFLQHAPAADRQRISLGNLTDIDTLFTRKFDVLLHWHGPEHLERGVFLDLLPKVLDSTRRMVILGCPNGPEEQGQAYGNPFEEHISFWSTKDFAELGFQAITVADKKPGHITAYRNLDNK